MQALENSEIHKAKAAPTSPKARTRPTVKCQARYREDAKHRKNGARLLRGPKGRASLPDPSAWAKTAPQVKRMIKVASGVNAPTQACSKFGAMIQSMMQNGKAMTKIQRVPSWRTPCVAFQSFLAILSLAAGKNVSAAREFKWFSAMGNLRPML